MKITCVENNKTTISEEITEEQLTNNDTEDIETRLAKVLAKWLTENEDDIEDWDLIEA
nr:MAG TPA: hypothetical protein [Caudoviricetes sp.]